MDSRQFSYMIVSLVLLVTMSAARSTAEDKGITLSNQLIKEAKKNFGYGIDESKIHTVRSQKNGKEDVVTSALLADSVKATSDQIKEGDVYAAVQCVAAQQLEGCFKVRLADVNDKEATFALVDKDGKTVATKTTTRAVASSSIAKRQLAKENRAQTSLWCVWINDVFVGCYDIVIIIFYE